MYEILFQKLSSYYLNDISDAPSNNPRYIAVDGVYNNDHNHQEVMNLGFYDMVNDIPIDITSFGTEGKNKEIKSVTEYISANIDNFRNTILVCDRGYHSHNFLRFLDENGLKFIIRIKYEGDNLIKGNPLLFSFLQKRKERGLRITIQSSIFGKR